MPVNKGGKTAAEGDALGLRDVMSLSDAAVDPCNVTSSLQFRFDSKTGNTLVEVTSPEGAHAVTQEIVLPGIDLTSRGSLTDSQVIQLLLSQGQLSTDI